MTAAKSTARLTREILQRIVRRAVYVTFVYVYVHRLDRTVEKEEGRRAQDLLRKERSGRILVVGSGRLDF